MSFSKVFNFEVEMSISSFNSWNLKIGAEFSVAVVVVVVVVVAAALLCLKS